MYEVETKVRTDHETVRERLESMGARYEGTVRQEDTYYDAPHREFAETDEALRVRREAVLETPGDRDDEGTAAVILTYKGPLLDGESKTREEIETELGDGDRTRALLEALGFEAAAEVEKRRATYIGSDAAGEWHAVLDSVSGLGQYLEVELEAEQATLEAARERVHEIVRELGLDPDEGIRTSYLELLLDADEEGHTRN